MKLHKAFELFDNYNKQDPNTIVWDGDQFPAEYFYSIQLHNWLLKIKPDAGEHLLLASRCQHIGRWNIPRETYPAGKAGYLRWRTDLAKFHATTAGNLLREAGYDDAEITKVQHILLKEGIKLDEEVQAMENALCLVFLEFQFNDFIEKHPDDKVIRILQKTWKKMSDPGRQAALTLPFHGRAKELMQKALQ